ncbi:hypothetical protein ElyMa_001996700 [Elysia marginata]|uniref:Uncharacterized protein n=1 Tax=Elysia marginata TaxID=1093978 RepID=A0AAV4F2A0_9GAST|nr:hypothetical protein ElyMa_001996700 [Elysia marginata]
MKFTGHIYGARGIEHGKKSRGRQRTTYVDTLNTWANLEQHTRSQFMRSSCVQARHLMMMMMYRQRCTRQFHVILGGEGSKTEKSGMGCLRVQLLGQPFLTSTSVTCRELCYSDDWVLTHQSKEWTEIEDTLSKDTTALKECFDT